MTLNEQQKADQIANERMLVELKLQAEREAAIAAEEDAALQAVRDQCYAYRAALKADAE
jgi:uncharacterized protein YdaU (DUF1376 family)